MPPVGFKRSRALWDDTRRPKNSKKDEWKSLARAILYELQPIRFSQYSHYVSVSVVTRFWTDRVLPVLRQVLSFATIRFPKMLLSTIRSMSLRHWMIVGGIVAYYCVVRWIHELLHAGPIVLILTALGAIFTVGLGEKVDGEVSAYSVFNRGFQRLLGEVDPDELANQYVGGGMLGGGGDAARMMRAPPMDEEPQHAGNRQNNRAVARQQDVQNDEDFDEDDYDDDDSTGDNNDQNQQQRRGGGGQSRRSGKKARRRNLEERNEIRRQRQAAQAMGFDGTGGQEEMVAMQRLIEDQVAGNQ